MNDSSSASFDLNAFFRESKETLLEPKKYFAALKTGGGINEPLIKAALYGVFAGIIAFIWHLLGFGMMRGGIIGGAVGIMVLVWYIVAAVIGLFIGAVILMVISSICRGSSDFESNARVVASAMVIVPVSALLGFISGISIVFGMLVMLIVNLYGLYILYNGLTETLKSKPETTRLVMYVLAGLLLLSTIIGMMTRNKVNRFMNEYGRVEPKEMVINPGND